MPEVQSNPPLVKWGHGTGKTNIILSYKYWKE